MAYMPPKGMVAKLISPPYDVLDTKEARQIAAGNYMSFLRVTRPELELADEIDPYVVGASDLLVVDNEPLTGTPSTLVGFIDGDVRILRAGAVPETSIRAALAAARRIDQ